MIRFPLVIAVSERHDRNPAALTNELQEVPINELELSCPRLRLIKGCLFGYCVILFFVTVGCDKFGMSTTPQKYEEKRLGHLTLSQEDIG